MPVLIDYYIIDPQRWFDLCALVISPDNVSKLVRQVGPCKAQKIEDFNINYVYILLLETVL